MAKARDRLGWSPQVALDDGIARSAAWYRPVSRMVTWSWQTIGSDTFIPFRCRS